jgi:hypothetical protein
VSDGIAILTGGNMQARSDARWITEVLMVERLAR